MCLPFVTFVMLFTYSFYPFNTKVKSFILQIEKEEPPSGVQDWRLLYW
jgi:hypothetical protein